jgi:hypothetical protein
MFALLKRYNSLLCQWMRLNFKQRKPLSNNATIDSEHDAYFKIQVPFKLSKISSSFDKLIDICAYSKKSILFRLIYIRSIETISVFVLENVPMTCWKTTIIGIQDFIRRNGSNT